MIVRVATTRDRESWSGMRTSLWPKTDDCHRLEIEEYFAGASIDIVEVLVCEVHAEVVGFLELNIRNFAEGSRSAQVPYVEAWYVKPEFHGRGYGKELMRHAEAWAIEKGFDELASDTEIDNTRSIKMHKHLGFLETERIVCFLKRLGTS